MRDATMQFILFLTKTTNNCLGTHDRMTCVWITCSLKVPKKVTAQMTSAMCHIHLVFLSLSLSLYPFYHSFFLFFSFCILEMSEPNTSLTWNAKYIDVFLMPIIHFNHAGKKRSKDTSLVENNNNHRCQAIQYLFTTLFFFSFFLSLFFYDCSLLAYYEAKHLIMFIEC